MRAIEIVTADGRQRRVDADNDPELFFALRGGGGSFGAVTALEIELYPVAEVYAGMVAWPGEMGSEIAHAYREWLAGAPDEITAQLRFMTLPPIPELPEPLRGKSLVDVTGAFIGDPAAGEELMRPLREIEGAVWDTWGVQPAPALRQLGMDPEEPVPGVGDSVTLGELTPEAVDALVALAGAGADSPLMGVQVRQLGGALGREDENAGALPKLDAEHVVFGVGAVFDPAARPAIDELPRQDPERARAVLAGPSRAQLLGSARGRRGRLPARGVGAAAGGQGAVRPGRHVRRRPAGGLTAERFSRAARTRRGCGRRG